MVILQSISHCIFFYFMTSSEILDSAKMLRYNQIKKYRISIIKYKKFSFYGSTKYHNRYIRRKNLSWPDGLRESGTGSLREEGARKISKKLDPRYLRSYKSVRFSSWCLDLQTSFGEWEARDTNFHLSYILYHFQFMLYILNI